MFRTKHLHQFALMIVTLLTALPLTVLAQEDETTSTNQETEARHRAALLRFVEEGINPGNFDLMDDVTAPEFVLHSPVGDLDREGVKAFLRALRDALTDFDMTVDTVLVEGDEAATRRTVTGIFDHEFVTADGPIPPNGQAIRVEILNLYRFNQDGLVVEEWALFDNLGFLTQLGAFPPAPSGNPAASGEQGSDTESVIRAFYKAANSDDWDTALSYWADDGTFTVMGNVMKGKEQIGAFMQAAAAEHGFVEVTQLAVTGDSATWISLPEAGGEFHLSATLQDGKFQSMTIQ